MSGEIDCYIELPDVKVSDQFFEKIDHCFEKIGFELCKNSESFFRTMVWMPEPAEDWKDIEWSERTQTLHKGNTLNLEYSSGESFWSVKIYYSGTMTAECVSIEAVNIGYLREYTEKDRDLAVRYQSVAQEIHRIFGATETKAMVEEYYDEPWFRFSENEWRTVGDLPLVKCKTPRLHMRAEKPREPLTRNYLRKGDTLLNSGRWKPGTPVAFESEFGEFHLAYADESGMRRAVLLCNCLCCGGLLPESERDSLFGRPSEDEERRFRRIAWRAKNSDEIIEILGKPDFFLGSVAYPERNAEEGIREQMVYTNLSDNTVVIFKESELGMFIVNYAGKWQGE